MPEPSTEAVLERQTERLKDDTPLNGVDFAGAAVGELRALLDRLILYREALPIFERVTRLAHTLASDVPITAEARKHIDRAYESLTALSRSGG